MTITVVNKKTFDSMMYELDINDGNVELQENKFFISIINTHGNDIDLHPWFHHDHKNVIRLFFDDVVPGDPDTKSVLFQPKHATKILKMSKQFNQGSEILIHCLAGQSRSAGVGSFIAEKYGIINDEDSFKHGVVFTPNFHVISVLRNLDSNDKNIK